MTTPIIGDLIQSTVGKVVGGLVDKYLPKSLSEEAKERLKLEAGRLAMEEYRAALSERASARELARADVGGAPPWTRALAALHRPLWSLLTLAIFCWTVLAPYLGYQVLDLSDIHKEIMQTVIVFYFGGRTVEKTASLFASRGS
ncbi:MAG TPA: hypothetical protein ENJ37_10300 [Deltaproteobacteria bacterium]|nr:hypothetical protein [Deltaproteobacteria bacterium]